MRTAHLLICTLMLILLSAMTIEAAPPEFRTLQIGDSAPDFELPGVDDRSYRLADFADFIARGDLDFNISPGAPDELGALRQALGLLDCDREPRLVMAARHNLTLALKESGRLEEALSSLQEILPLHARSGKTMDRLRLRWLEGHAGSRWNEYADALATAFQRSEL